MIEPYRVRVPVGAEGEFSSPGSAFVLTLISLFVPPPVTAVARKKSRGHSAKSTGGWLQLNTHAPYICGFA